MVEIWELGINIWESFLWHVCWKLQRQLWKRCWKDSRPRPSPGEPYLPLESEGWRLCGPGLVLSHCSGQKQFSAQGSVSGGTASPTISVLKGPSPTDPRSLDRRSWQLGRTVSPLFIFSDLCSDRNVPQGWVEGILVCQVIHSSA